MEFDGPLLVTHCEVSLYTAQSTWVTFYIEFYIALDFTLGCTFHLGLHLLYIFGVLWALGYFDISHYTPCRSNSITNGNKQ